MGGGGELHIITPQRREAKNIHSVTHLHILFCIAHEAECAFIHFLDLLWGERILCRLQCCPQRSSPSSAGTERGRRVTQTCAQKINAHAHSRKLNTFPMNEDTHAPRTCTCMHMHTRTRTTHTHTHSCTNTSNIFKRHRTNRAKFSLAHTKISSF